MKTVGETQARRVSGRRGVEVESRGGWALAGVRARAEGLSSVGGGVNGSAKLEDDVIC